MKKIVFNIDENLFKNFKKYCIDEEITMTDFFITTIKEILEHENNK